LLRQHFSVTDSQLGSLQNSAADRARGSEYSFGILADRFSQHTIIAGGVLFWSLAAMCSGLAPTFTALFVCRGLVGIGEASVRAGSPGDDSDSFPLSIEPHTGNLRFGNAAGRRAGLALGGIMGERHGWQYAFLIVGAIGIIPVFRLSS